MPSHCGVRGLAIFEDVEAALGVAWFAALGTAHISPGDGEGWITLVERVTPDEARKPRHDALYPALSNQMHALAALRGPVACRTPRGRFHMRPLCEDLRRHRRPCCRGAQRVGESADQMR